MQLDLPFKLLAGHTFDGVWSIAYGRGGMVGHTRVGGRIMIYRSKITIPFKTSSINLCNVI